MNSNWDLVRDGEQEANSSGEDEDVAQEASARFRAGKSLFPFNVPFYGGFAPCPGHLGWEIVG